MKYPYKILVRNREGRVISSGPISYRRLKSGGYELTETAYVQTTITGVAARIVGYVELRHDGMLIVRKGYRWDGATVIPDTLTNMRASLYHDATFQLGRAGRFVAPERQPFDQLFRELYIEDGGWRWIGALDYIGLRIGAGHAFKRQPDAENVILTAP